MRVAVAGVFGLDSPLVDAGETMLRLLGYSWKLVAFYSDLLDMAYSGDDAVPEALRGSGVAALVGFRHVLGKDGERVPVAELTRGLVRLHAEERDRCARYAQMVVEARLSQAQAGLLEVMGDQLAALAEGIVADLGMRPHDPDVEAVVARRLAMVEGAG